MRVRLYLLIWFLIALVAPSALAQDQREQANKFLECLLNKANKFECFPNIPVPIIWIGIVFTGISVVIAGIATFTGDLDKLIDFIQKCIDLIRKCFFPTKPTTSAADIQIIRPQLLVCQLLIDG
jgi:hypothetical protein